MTRRCRAIYPSDDKHCVCAEASAGHWRKVFISRIAPEGCKRNQCEMDGPFTLVEGPLSNPPVSECPADTASENTVP